MVLRSSSASPITISSLAVITLNSDTLSAAVAGSIIMLPIRQARARPRPARFDICICDVPHSGARQARKGKTKPRATAPWSHGVVNTFDGRRDYDAILFRLQLQRRRVDAVAQAGRAGAVGEDVAEMAVALASTAPRCGSCRGSVIALLVDMALDRRAGRSSASRSRNRTWRRTRTASGRSRRRHRCRRGGRAHIRRRRDARSPSRAARRTASATIRCATRSSLLLTLSSVVFCLGVGHGSPVCLVIPVVGDLAISWWPCWHSPASASQCSCPRTASSGSRPSGCR